MSPEERATLKKLVDEKAREHARPHCPECGRRCPPSRTKPRKFCCELCCKRYLGRLGQRRYYARKKLREAA